MTEEVEGSEIKISMSDLKGQMKIQYLLGSETKFILSIGSLKDTSMPYFLHIWINKKNIKKFRKQIDEALKQCEEIERSMNNV